MVERPARTRVPCRTQDVELEPERTRRLLVHAFLLNSAASLDAAVPAPTSVTDAAHTQDTSVPLQEQQAVVPLQEQWFVALQAQIWVVALQAGAPDSQNASPRISPNASPRTTGT